nr:cold shock domain-containing protein [uncultured Desulfobulbus sp.]
MQTEGTLTKWNDDKGYGMITPQRGGRDIWVELAAFPQDGSVPQLHEKLSVTFEIDKNGKQTAVLVTRQTTATTRPQPPISGRKRSSTTTAFASLALFIAVLGYGYLGLYRNDESDAVNITTTDAPSRTLDPKCDGRTLCSQMTSCTEAEFFLRHCPNVQLDANGDGIPCEQQWCGK